MSGCCAVWLVVVCVCVLALPAARGQADAEACTAAAEHGDACIPAAHTREQQPSEISYAQQLHENKQGAEQEVEVASTQQQQQEEEEKEGEESVAHDTQDGHATTESVENTREEPRETESAEKKWYEDLTGSAELTLHFATPIYRTNINKYLSPDVAKVCSSNGRRIMLHAHTHMPMRTHVSVPVSVPVSLLCVSPCSLPFNCFFFFVCVCAFFLLANESRQHLLKTRLFNPLVVFHTYSHNAHACTCALVLLCLCSTSTRSCTAPSLTLGTHTLTPTLSQSLTRIATTVSTP